MSSTDIIYQIPQPFDQEYFEERAAIREFDGGYTRKEAERLAMIDLRRQANLLRKKS